MFDQISRPAVRRRSPLAAAASIGVHVAACAAVMALAQTIASKPPRSPQRDLTFVNVVPVPVADVPPKSVVVLPKLVLESAPDMAPTPPPVPVPILEVAAYQPKPEPFRQVLIKDAVKPAPVVVGTFATLASADTPAPAAKQVAPTAFGLEQAKAPDLKVRQSAVGAFDSTSSKEAQTGSDRTRPNTIADAGFGSSGALRRDGVGSSPNPNAPAASNGFDGVTSSGAPRRAETQQVQQAGFNASPSAKVEKLAVAQDRVSVPVEVLFKPAPVYTREARNLKIEGAVSLEVEFCASGKVKILRVVSGLGHGLDEAASDAAERIQFKPARSGNLPVDQRAIVHITFRLT